MKQKIHLEDLKVEHESRRKLIARMTRRYFYEDYMRVYPDNLFFDGKGRQYKHMDKDWTNNYLNHRKVYRFASQFVKNKTVADIGCGSGYGCEILERSGALSVHGADLSEHAVQFAQARYGHVAHFTLQNVVKLKEYRDEMFDVTVSSEVLEHIREFGKEEKALKELKRITKKEGLVVIAVPNSELTRGHGFFFTELDELLNKHFSRHCIFENALLPFGDRRTLWEKRLLEGNTGIIVSQNIDLSETMKIADEPHELKKGMEPGIYTFGHFFIDTTLLHNTHSWIALAVYH